MHKCATISNGELSGCLTPLRAWGMQGDACWGSILVHVSDSQATIISSEQLGQEMSKLGPLLKERAAQQLYNSSRMTRACMMHKLTEQANLNTTQYIGCLLQLYTIHSDFMPTRSNWDEAPSKATY